MPPRKRDEPAIKVYLVNLKSGPRWVTHVDPEKTDILAYGWSDGLVTWKDKR